MELLSRQFQGRAAELIAWMVDESVTDILVNGTSSLYVDRGEGLEPHPNPFPDRASLNEFIERLVIPIGRRIDAAYPCLDGRTLDGSRFHIVLPPIAVEGPLVSIRKLKPGGARLQPFADDKILGWLKSQVADRRNILICGATGTGKTTLLAHLLEEVPKTERIAIIEESMEIQTSHPHVFHLEGRPPTPDGRGEVSLRSLVRNALRMRPDRIVLGEVRGAEAFEMIQAMNTGHSGSLGTIHSNGAVEALRRLESLVLLNGQSLPLRAVREWVASAIQLVVFLKRNEGVRRIEDVLSVEGLEGEVFRITPRVKKGVLGA